MEIWGNLLILVTLFICGWYVRYLKRTNAPKAEAYSVISMPLVLGIFMTIFVFTDIPNQLSEYLYTMLGVLLIFLTNLVAYRKTKVKKSS